MSRLSLPQARILAVLLDADGATVSYAALGAVVGTSGVNEYKAIRSYAERLRERVGPCVEVVPRRGLRLTAVPPDWTLDTVLWVLDDMRRTGQYVPVRYWGRTA